MSILSLSDDCFRPTVDSSAILAVELEEEKRAEVALRMRRVCPTARRGPLGAG
jgi:hypothetical protein